ncbi:hypothetical protein [Cytobacillus depressus]|uniref:hypothetical protein n=1 Tax=Cytobacillus depressus TaxID=1602942 RepID=UPI001FE822C0|nr:hypothetical protein [Cytobacillus depressus]
MRELSDTDIKRYIERADAWIRRATSRDFSETENTFIQADMRTATLLLVEYIWYWDNPEPKEEAMSHDEIIRLGSFTVHKESARSGELTGMDELDFILKTYRYKPTVGLFQVLRKG